MFLIRYLVVASLDHEQRGFVVLDAHKERCKRASVLLRCVEQHWLVHRDPHRQPGPQREQLQHSLVSRLNNLLTSFILILITFTIKSHPFRLCWTLIYSNNLWELSFHINFVLNVFKHKLKQYILVWNFTWKYIVLIWRSNCTVTSYVINSSLSGLFSTRSHQTQLNKLIVYWTIICVYLLFRQVKHIPTCSS